MPESIAAINIDFERSVRNIVEASFPIANLDLMGMRALISSAESSADSTVLMDKASGKRIFVMGTSRWGGSDVIGA